MATTYVSPLLRLGVAADIVRPQLRLLAADASPPTAIRGLTIKEITLNKDFDGWFDDDSEIYFISTALDFSGKDPVVFPVGDATQTTLKLEPGETFRFSLGEGAPVFPEREITSGLVVQVHLFESDQGARDAAAAITKATDAVKTDGNLVKVLKQLFENPGGLAVDVVLGAAGEVAKVVSAVLESNGNDNVAFFTGYWSAEGSWDGKLEATQEGASIRFGELPPTA